MSGIQQALLQAWYSAGSPASVDPYFSNVALLLHMDGSNGGTTFTDSSSYARAVTASSVTTSTSTAGFFGTSAGSMAGGSTTTRLSVADSTDFDFGNKDFTIECRVYLTSLTNNYCVFNIGGDASGLALIFYSDIFAHVTGSPFFTSSKTFFPINSSKYFGEIP